MTEQLSTTQDITKARLLVINQSSKEINVKALQLKKRSEELLKQTISLRKKAKKLSQN